MKSKRTISIKDPQLRIVRNNLRSIIISAASVKKSESLKAENNDESMFWEIERPLRTSILLCSACFQSDKNMNYNPVRRIWYHTEWYEVLKKGNEKRGTPEELY